METSMSHVASDDVAKNPDIKNDVSVADVVVNSENTALNVMVAFLNVAQKRGSFNMNESAKIWECIQYFSKRASVPDTDVK